MFKQKNYFFKKKKFKFLAFTKIFVFNGGETTESRK